MTFQDIRGKSIIEITRDEPLHSISVQRFRAKEIVKDLAGSGIW